MPVASCVRLLAQFGSDAPMSVARDTYTWADPPTVGSRAVAGGCPGPGGDDGEGILPRNESEGLHVVPAGLTEVVNDDGGRVRLCDYCLVQYYRRSKHGDLGILAYTSVGMVLCAVILALYLSGRMGLGDVDSEVWQRIVPAFEDLADLIRPEGWTILGVLVALLVAITLSAEQSSRRRERVADSLERRVLDVATVREYAHLRVVDAAEFVAAQACLAVVVVVALAGIVGMRDPQGWLLFFASVPLTVWAWASMSRASFQVRPAGRLDQALARVRRDELRDRRVRQTRASGQTRSRMVVAWWTGLLLLVPAAALVQGVAVRMEFVYSLLIAVPLVGLLHWWLIAGTARSANFETGASRKLTLGLAMTSNTAPGALILAAVLPVLGGGDVASWLIVTIFIWMIVLGALLALGTAGSGPLAALSLPVRHYTRPARAAEYVRDAGTARTRGTATWIATALVAPSIVFLATLGWGTSEDAVRATTLLAVEMLVVGSTAKFVLVAEGRPRLIAAAFMYLQVIGSAVLNLDRWTGPEGATLTAWIATAVAFATLLLVAVGVSAAVPRRVRSEFPPWMRVPALLVQSRALSLHRRAQARLRRLGESNQASNLPNSCDAPGCGQVPVT